MTDRDESFGPESLQEQLDQLAQAASHSTRPNIADTRLEEDLRTVYTEYTQAGERVWARLAEHLAEQDPQDEALMTLLQNVNLDPRLVDPQERAGILSQARTRLFQTNPETFKAEQRAAPALREPGSFPSKPTTLAGKPLRSRRLLHMLNMLAAALVIVALLGASLLLFRHRPSTSSNSSTHAVQKLTAATPAGIQLGPQSCPKAVQSTSHWETILGLKANQQVEGVLCGYLMGAPSLQAVVKVRNKGTDDLLDIVVYTYITSAQPSSIFSLKGLPHGDVSISNYNTLLTGEIEPKPNQGAGVPTTTAQQDLYREFKWSDSAGTLVQITFPGFFPDLTRYQAEYEQNQVNTGQGYQQWRLSAVTTAQNFAEFVLGWDPNAPTTVLSGGGKNDAKALILVKNRSADNATIKLSLSRLELNTNGGIWEVTGVATDGMTITSPQDAQQLTSPIQVTGTGKALAGKPTTIKVFDHDRTVIGQSVMSVSGSAGKSNIATSISYSSSFPGETQEGIIALYTFTTNHIIDGVVMVKVLLSA